MKRGTRVASAYVAITADGSGINDDIADAFDDVDYRDIGDKHGQQYSDSIRHHLAGLEKDFGSISDRLGKNLPSRLSRAIETDSALSQGVAKMLAEAFDSGKMEDLVEHVGRRAGVTFGGEFDREVRASVMNSLEGALNDAVRRGDLDLSGLLRTANSGSGDLDILGPVMDRAVKDVEAAQKRMEAAVERSVAERAKQERIGEQLAQKIRDDAVKNWEKLLDERDRANERSVKLRIRQEAMGDRIVYAMQQQAAKEWERMLAARDKADADHIKMLNLAANMNKKFDADRMKMLIRASEMNKKFDTDRMKTLLQAHSMNEKFDAARLRTLETAHRMNAQFNAARLKEIHEAHRLNERFDKERMDNLQRMGRMQEAALRMNEKHRAGLLSGQGLAVSRNEQGGIGDVVGRMFGAGSRNNALNLLGKTVGNVVGLVEKGAKFAGIFAEGMASAGQSASLIAKFGGGLGAVGASLGTTFASLAASAPVIVAGFAAVLVVMSAMVSVAGALLAIVTALVSTIASALVGALAVAGPLLGALAVAGGLVTMAFTSMTNAQIDYMKRAFEPFHEAITGVGQIIATQFTKPLYDGQSAFQVWSTNLQKALVPLAGVAQSTAKAFADAGNTITASLSGPGFVRFFSSLSTELPTIIRNLSSALGGFLNGVAGMFAAIMPYVTQFSQYLDDVATRFSKWANSAKGQNSISDFVERAVESLKALWGFIKEVGGLFADIFFDKRSQKAGNSIFEGMRQEVEKFREKLKGVDLKKWFEDAIDWGKKMWRGIKDIAKVIQRLYDDGTLAAVGSSFETMAAAIKQVSDALSPLVNLMKNDAVEALNDFANPLSGLTGQVEGLANAVEMLQDAFDRFTGWGPDGPPSAPEAPTQPWDEPGGSYPQARYTVSRGGRRKKRGQTLFDVISARGKGPELEDLIASGNTALANTYEQYGGHMPDPEDPSKGGKSGDKDKDKEKDKVKHHGAAMAEQWANPYRAFAAAIMALAPTLADELRAAGRQAREVIAEAYKDMEEMFSEVTFDIGKSMLEGIADATKAFDADDVISSFTALIDSAGEQIASAVSGNRDNAWNMKVGAYDSANALISSAQEARNQAAADLAAATTPKQAARALEKLKQADRDLAVAKSQARKVIEDADRTYDAMIAAGEAAGAGVNRARQIMADQAVVNEQNVTNILGGGVAFYNATLADWAEARGRVAEMLADANAELADALALRDNYANAISDSVRNYGSLLTAQAKVLNGVQQQLTADDVTDNLRERLAKIQEFRDDMRLLLSMGLSDSAYKQIMDAGVETGGAYADAIIAGGQGAVSEVNDLTSQIDLTSEFLGNEAANFLYQAGVDAAQGLVDGLTSLSAELDSAAAQLGAAISDAIKRELGIASPSKVMFGLMFDDVGDGMVNGLDAAQAKVGVAAGNLASQVAVSPEVAAYAASQGTSPTVDENGENVSGNVGKQFVWNGDIVTPTEDPVAVSNEVINEITERL